MNRTITGAISGVLRPDECGSPSRTDSACSVSGYGLGAVQSSDPGRQALCRAPVRCGPAASQHSGAQHRPLQVGWTRGWLRAGKDETPLHVAVALLGSLRAMITHDDDRPPASKAFMHARMLALDRGAVPVFLAVLRRALSSPPELCAAISALQALCANDDVCKQVRYRSPAALRALAPTTAVCALFLGTHS